MTVTAAVNAVREVESYNDNARRRGTVDANVDIPKNSLLKLADDNLFSQATGTADIIAGVSSDDKEGDDPSLSIGVYGPGIFEFTSSGSITSGDLVASAAAATANQVYGAGDSSTETATIVGVAVNSTSNGERVRVRMNL